MHTPSEYVAAEVVAEFGVDPARVRAVHHGVPELAGPVRATACRRGTVPRASRRAADRYVLAVGTIEPRKDYPLLVRSFESVAAAHPDVALVIVGQRRLGFGGGSPTQWLSSTGAGTGSSGPATSTTAPWPPPCAGPPCWPTRRAYEGFGFPPLQAMARRGAGGGHRRRGGARGGRRRRVAGRPG